MYLCLHSISRCQLLMGCFCRQDGLLLSHTLCYQLHGQACEYVCATSAWLSDHQATEQHASHIAAMTAALAFAHASQPVAKSLRPSQQQDQPHAMASTQMQLQPMLPQLLLFVESMCASATAQAGREDTAAGAGLVHSQQAALAQSACELVMAIMASAAAADQPRMGAAVLAACSSLWVRAKRMLCSVNLCPADECCHAGSAG